MVEAQEQAQKGSCPVDRSVKSRSAGAGMWLSVFVCGVGRGRGMIEEGREGGRREGEGGREKGRGESINLAVEHNAPPRILSTIKDIIGEISQICILWSR